MKTRNRWVLFFSDLDKNRRSYEVSSSSKKQKPAYRSEDFSARSDRKHGGLDSTDGFQREERPATGKKVRTLNCPSH